MADEYFNCKTVPADEFHAKRDAMNNPQDAADRFKGALARLGQELVSLATAITTKYPELAQQMVSPDELRESERLLTIEATTLERRISADQDRLGVVAGKLRFVRSCIAEFNTKEAT